MPVIERSTVIRGAVEDVYTKEATDIKSVTVTLDAAAVQALNTVPVELLPDPPAGHAYSIIGVYSQKAAAAYADGADVGVNYTDTANTEVATIPLAHFTSAADARWATRAALSGAPAAQTLPPNGVDMSVSTAFTGSGADIVVAVRYVLTEI